MSSCLAGITLCWIKPRVAYPPLSEVIKSLFVSEHLLAETVTVAEIISKKILAALFTEVMWVFTCQGSRLTFCTGCTGAPNFFS